MPPYFLKLLTASTVDRENGKREDFKGRWMLFRLHVYSLLNVGP